MHTGQMALSIQGFGKKMFYFINYDKKKIIIKNI